MKKAPTRIQILFTLAMLGFVIGCCARTEAAEPVEVRSGLRVWRLDPATLKLETVTGTDKALLLSDGQRELGPVEGLRKTTSGATWQLPQLGVSVVFSLAGDEGVMRFTLDKSGQITWPVIAPDSNVRALLLPRGEGSYVPVDDEGWAAILQDENSLTEEFSFPCWGLDLGPETVSYLVPDPFDTSVQYSRRAHRIGFALTRRFTRLDPQRVWEVRVAFGAGSPVEPALRYRKWLIDQGKFVPMADKIKRVPRGERLLGALQAYLWGLPFSTDDVQDWKAFASALAAAAKAGPQSAPGKVWTALSADGRKAVQNLAAAQWVYDYLREEVTRALAEAMSRGSLTSRQLDRAFPGLLTDPGTWGDGISTAFLNSLRSSGIDRACLILNDLHSGDTRPEVARLADQLGYLYGPYDSYDAVHPPGMKDSWETAQFDADLYAHGGIEKEDGSLIKGFKQVGRMLSPLAARPYVERRVRAQMVLVPHSAWFMDCDAFGQFYDDFSPEHTATQAQDCAARLDRMRWIETSFGIPVGSEGGSGLAAGVIFFAHGMLTGVIGWGDKDLTNEHSKYWMGGYWPPEAPKNSFMPALLKPKYRLESYDPRYRLPLYEAVFHDSVIATHEWGTPSLKFKGEETTTALIEQLYNVPPLYHFTRKEFAQRQKGILAHYRFFSPLHRRLGLAPMTAFEWLTPDRLVQRTRFGDGTEITANFGTRAWNGNGLEVPAHTVVARRGAVTTSYTPSY
jgi:hypothetical protein